MRLSIQPPLSQYFLEPPFAAITAASLLVYVSTSFANQKTEIFALSSLKKLLKFSQIRWRAFVIGSFQSSSQIPDWI